jgi:hypothetical protein
MAQPADTFSSYDAVGNREDLSDFISMISPTRTPFQSGVGRRSATSTKVEWQLDSLAAASASNAVIEGDDATTDASAATSRVFNYTQILDKVPRVTGTQRALDSAGRADEMDYQIMKRTKEIKRDLETSLLDNNAQVAGNDTTAREMGGIESWIATNTNLGSGGSAPTGDGTDARTGGTDRAFTEALLRDVIKQCYDSGGEPDTIMVGSFNKQVLSQFSGGSTSNIDAEKKTIVNAVDVYVSDFGTMAVVPNRFQEAESALVLEMDKWEIAELRPFQRMDLAKTGDTDRAQLLMEVTLVSVNEAASGIVSDLTSS